MKFAISHLVYIRPTYFRALWPATPEIFNEIYCQKWTIVQVPDAHIRRIEIKIEHDTVRMLVIHVSHLTEVQDSLVREPLTDTKFLNPTMIARGEKVGLSLRGLGNAVLRGDFEFDDDLRWPKAFSEALDFSKREYYFMGYKENGDAILKFVGREQYTTVPPECVRRLRN